MQAKLLQHAVEDDKSCQTVKQLEYERPGAVPITPPIGSADPHCRAVGGALQGAGVLDTHDDARGEFRPVSWHRRVMLRGDLVERFQETLRLIAEMGNDPLNQHALRCIRALVEVIERQVYDAADIAAAVELRESVELVAERDQRPMRVQRAFRMGAGAG